MVEDLELQAYESVKNYGCYSYASKALGIPVSTLRSRSDRYRERMDLPNPSKVSLSRNDKSVCREAYESVIASGSYVDASKTLRIPVGTLRDRSERYRLENDLPVPLSSEVGSGARLSKHYMQPDEFMLPEEGEVKRYILTCAQNNTGVHDSFWKNLLILKDHYKAELHVSRFTYAKGEFTGSGKPGTEKESDTEDIWYDPLIVSHISDKPVRLAPGIIWCGELNILPTAVLPLSGLATYTRDESMVVPHVKVAMESYAVMKGDVPRFGYTTGTVTLRNYIQMKAGQKAEFHHVYGVLLVEVDCEGRWWARQVSADDEGNFQDLDLVVRDGVLTRSNPVESVTWGDIHRAQVSLESHDASWFNSNSISHTLKPKYQVFHDVLDFLSRNHHEDGDCHREFYKHVVGQEEVEEEVGSACYWLRQRKDEARSWGGEIVVVPSNHDDFFVKWLKKANYRNDPVNAVYFLKAQLAYYMSIQDHANGYIDRVVPPFEWAYNKKFPCEEIRFLHENESFVVAGVEHSMHGHLGPNGVRGNRNNLKNLGVKLNIGHSHSASIVDGVYQAGTSSVIDMGYNKGVSSWSHSHILTYSNGKRCILTIRDGKWCAL